MKRMNIYAQSDVPFSPPEMKREKIEKGSKNNQKTRAEQKMAHFYMCMCVLMYLDNVNTMNNSSNSNV